MLKIEPKIDQNGKVVAHDNEAIPNESLVIRRVSERQVITLPDGQRRISSILMAPSTEGNLGISVDLEVLIISDSLNPKEFVTTPRWLASIAILVADLRGDGYLVGYDPIPTNKYHGEIWGDFTGDKKNKMKKGLLKKALWYVELPNVSIT